MTADSQPQTTKCYKQVAVRWWIVATAVPSSPLRMTSPRGERHSHSIVPGGFDVMSYATRFTPATSLMIREAIVSSTS